MYDVEHRGGDRIETEQYWPVLAMNIDDDDDDDDDDDEDDEDDDNEEEEEEEYQWILMAFKHFKHAKNNTGTAAANSHGGGALV